MYGYTCIRMHPRACVCVCVCDRCHIIRSLRYDSSSSSSSDDGGSNYSGKRIKFNEPFIPRNHIYVYIYIYICMCVVLYIRSFLHLLDVQDHTNNDCSGKAFKVNACVCVRMHVERIKESRSFFFCLIFFKKERHRERERHKERKNKRERSKYKIMFRFLSLLFIPSILTVLSFFFFLQGI